MSDETTDLTKIERKKAEAKAAEEAAAREAETKAAEEAAAREAEAKAAEEAAASEAEFKAAREKAEAEYAAMEDAKDRLRSPLRFSAPNLIGGRISGFDVGDRLRISDSAANDGVHTVAAVVDGWLVLRGATIRDEPPTPHARIAYVIGDES